MNPWLWTVVVLLVLLGLVHSVLGERYILVRLFRRDLPKLFGSDDFTKRTLRFAWHLTTVVWWGVAWVVVQLASDDVRGALDTLAATALLSSAIALVGSRGKHLAWVVFLIVAAGIWFGTHGTNSPRI